MFVDVSLTATKSTKYIYIYIYIYIWNPPCARARPATADTILSSDYTYYIHTWYILRSVLLYTWYIYIYTHRLRHEVVP